MCHLINQDTSTETQKDSNKKFRDREQLVCHSGRRITLNIKGDTYSLNPWMLQNLSSTKSFFGITNQQLWDEIFCLRGNMWPVLVRKFIFAFLNALKKLVLVKKKLLNWNTLQPEGFSDETSHFYSPNVEGNNWNHPVSLCSHWRVRGSSTKWLSAA